MIELWQLIKKDHRANGGKAGSIIGIVVDYYLRPGFSVIVRHRLASRARGWIFPFSMISKFFWIRNIRLYGCHFSPLAKIEESLALPHPVGIVIGDGVLIGSNVRIYQNVTIGRKNHREEEVPQVMDHAIIYAGAVIVGAINIGANAVVAANSVVTKSVANGGCVAGIPARQLDAPLR